MQYTVHVFRDNVVFAGGIKNVICQVLSSKYIFFYYFLQQRKHFTNIHLNDFCLEGLVEK